MKKKFLNRIEQNFDERLSLYCVNERLYNFFVGKYKIKISPSVKLSFFIIISAHFFSNQLKANLFVDMRGGQNVERHFVESSFNRFVKSRETLYNRKFQVFPYRTGQYLLFFIDLTCKTIFDEVFN